MRNFLDVHYQWYRPEQCTIFIRCVIRQQDYITIINIVILIIMVILIIITTSMIIATIMMIHFIMIILVLMIIATIMMIPTSLHPFDRQFLQRGGQEMFPAPQCAATPFCHEGS